MGHTPPDQIVDRLIYTLMEYEPIAKEENRPRIRLDLVLLRESRKLFDSSLGLLNVLEDAAEDLQAWADGHSGEYFPETQRIIRASEVIIAEAKP